MNWLGTPVIAALVVGFALRALFVARHPLFVGDALVYGEMAHHMLKEHVYGLMDAGVLKPTLIRLPGYPLFLAAVFKVFGDANYLAVIWVQVFVDLATCGLLAATAAQVAGRRAGMWVLWLAVLCPFTANYAAVVVAECWSMFCVALAMYGLARWSGESAVQRVSELAARDGVGRLRWAAVVGVALSAAVLLRPDQGLLAAAVAPGMLWVGLRSGSRQWRVRVAPALVASVIVVLPLCLWAVRNWRVFHVVQPLSPKYANDPGEEVPLGFMRWYRTWAIGFPATVKVYWQYDGDLISMNDLPARAFDSPEQRAETAAIYRQYNEESASTPAVDGEFARLAEERVRAHPFRYYVELPVARVADMWFRPRIEYMKVPLDWWRLSAHPWNSLRAYALGALNVCYLAMACVGLWVWRRRGGVVVWSMVAFVALRCVLLLTIDNSEPRYTMECYPVVVLLAGLAMSAPGLKPRSFGALFQRPKGRC
jgi:4-amino-4-deoxy-L-arabinose transferase-like glycosyltransferase